MRKNFLTIIFIFLFISIYGQEGFIVRTKVIDGDTIPYIITKEIIVTAKRKFKNKRQERKYKRLIYNVKKVYPYVKVSRETYKKVLTNTKGMTKSERRKYIKIEEKILREKYAQGLKKLTITQGRILIKLIDRETGDTSYKVVKELKGGFTAVVFQSLALLFGENLKSEYDKEGEDKLIEDIIILIDAGVL